MDTFTKPEIPYYSIMGVLFSILPYYGKQENWPKLLLPICKKSKLIWNSNQPALLGLQKKTKWRDPDNIKLSKLYHEIIGREVVFNDEIRLHLDLYDEDDAVFMGRASEFQCPNYKELEITNVCDDPESVKILNDFLCFCTPSYIGSFTISKDIYSDVDMSTFSLAIETILPAITFNIEICEFTIDQACLKNIIEGARNARSLSIVDCTIELNDTFIIDPNIEFKLTELVINGS
jgi:hypothetical protein